MYKNLFYVILLIFVFQQNSLGQDRSIKADTTDFWYKNNQKLIRKFQLTDFKTTQADFAFRFKNYGQIIEIIKEDSRIQGRLVNYVFRSFKKQRDTLFEKIQLDSVKAGEVYDLVKQSGILDLASENQIKNWKQGLDGTTYIFEQADKKSYQLKHYWSPQSQDSIPESLVVIDFIKSLSAILDSYPNNMKSLTGFPSGSYNWGGNVNMLISRKNFYSLGYSGASRLPFGFNATVFLNEFRKTHLGLLFSGEYIFDGQGNNELSLDLSKYFKFTKKSKVHNYISYRYERRQLDFIETGNILQAHKIKYGLSLGKTYFFLNTGIDYRRENREETGWMLGATKFFMKQNIRMSFDASIFKEEFDFKTGIDKSFHVHSDLISSLNLGIFFENFKDYNDVRFNLSVSF